MSRESKNKKSASAEMRAAYSFQKHRDPHAFVDAEKPNGEEVKMDDIFPFIEECVDDHVIIFDSEEKPAVVDDFFEQYDLPIVMDDDGAIEEQQQIPPPFPAAQKRRRIEVEESEQPLYDEKKTRDVVSALNEIPVSGSNGIGSSSSSVDNNRRFKEWLDVKPGARQYRLREQLRSEFPQSSEAEIRSKAEAKFRSDESRRRGDYERLVVDDSAVRVLLHSYLSEDDAEAYSIWQQYQKNFYFREYRDNQREAQRLWTEAESAVALCKKATKTQNKSIDVALRALCERFPTLRTSETTTGRMADGAAIDSALPPAMQAAAMFVADFTSDPSEPPSLVHERNVNTLSLRAMSALSITAELVHSAPREARFLWDGEEPHPVETMIRILNAAVPEEKITAEHVSKYLEHTVAAPPESAADVSDAFARRHAEQELNVVRRRLAEFGFDECEISSMSEFGTDPRTSAIARRVCEFLTNESFETARTELLADNSQAKKQPRSRRRAAGAVDAVDETPPVSFTKAAHEAAVKLPCIPRAYLQKYMREPRGDAFLERPCGNGTRCVCMMLGAAFPFLGAQIGGLRADNVSGAGDLGTTIVDEADNNAPICADPSGGPIASHVSLTGRHQNGFIAMEFLLPHEEEVKKTRFQLPAFTKTCILCNRFATSDMHFRGTQQRGPCEPYIAQDILQDHCVIVDQVGEYDRAACLTTRLAGRYFTGIVRPFVQFSFSHYRFSQCTVDGRQHNCIVETAALDFRPASVSAMHI